MRTCASAQDNPILRQLLEQKIVEELVKHDSEDTAWYNEKSKNKKKLLQMNLFGREIDKKVASWTEESKTWVWLQNPQEHLQVELKQFAIRDGRVEFALRATGKVRFKAWGRIQRLAQGAAGGNAWFEIEIGGSAALADNGLKDSSITTLAGTLGGLAIQQRPGRPLGRRRRRLRSTPTSSATTKSCAKAWNARSTKCTSNGASRTQSRRAPPLASHITHRPR